MVGSERARDEVLHDLVGAAVDLLDARVLVHSGDRVFADVPVTTEQLDAFVDDPALLVGLRL